MVRRLTRLNLQVLAVTMLLTFALIATASLLVVREQQAQSAQRDAQLLANSLAPMLVFEDIAAAQLEMSAFARRGGVLSVQVQRLNQSLFAIWLEPGQSGYAVARAPPDLANMSALLQMHMNSLDG